MNIRHWLWSALFSPPTAELRSASPYSVCITKKPAHWLVSPTSGSALTRLTMLFLLPTPLPLHFAPSRRTIQTPSAPNPA